MPVEAAVEDGVAVPRAEREVTRGGHHARHVCGELPADVLQGDARVTGEFGPQPVQPGRREVAHRAPSRNCRKNWRMSATSRSGSSMAAKWPPRSNSLQCTMLFDSSAKRLIGGAISKGNTATPVGTVE